MRVLPPSLKNGCWNLWIPVGDSWRSFGCQIHRQPEGQTVQWSTVQYDRMLEVVFPRQQTPCV